MKENRTPYKLPARSAENRNGRGSDFSSKKLNKFTNKSLNAAFSSVSEDSADLSPISEISDANPRDDVIDLLEKPSSVTLLPSDITPSKEITDMTRISSANCFGANQLGSSELPSMEVEFVVNFLRNVKPKVLNSVSAAPQYKKLVDEIIEYIIQDFHTDTLPEERDHLAQILPAKKQMLFLGFFIWIIGVSVVIFFNSDMYRPYRGPMPT